MKRLIKYIVLSLVVSCAGCFQKNTELDFRGAGYYTPSRTNETTSVKFNEEVYVWESLNVSTNRIK